MPFEARVVAKSGVAKIEYELGRIVTQAVEQALVIIEIAEAIVVEFVEG